MLPYASVEAIGGTQAVADVAGYIDTLEISVENGKGDGKDLELGASLYADNCARCHGAQGEGNGKKFRPRIQAQHYNYLVAQFEQIRAGTRRNADPKMTDQIKNFEDREMRAVLDYVSRLQPPEELQAPPGWSNPDFDQPTVLQSKR
jgi:cytochrome c553